MNAPVLNRHRDDRPVLADPARSYTMPARFYYDEQVYEAEKDAIFYRGWWYSGHVSQLAAAGSYLTTQIHEQSVAVVRGKGGELKAFYNVCQHRGHELLRGAGKTRRIVCPYHAWAYDLDGSLAHARNTDDMPGFDKCDFALKPVRVEVFCGLVFVNLDPQAEPLSTQVGEMEAQLREHCPRLDELVFSSRMHYHLEANWKVVVDNYLECYHCAPAHKAFVDLVDMPTYRSRTGSIWSSHIAGGARADNSAFRFDRSETDFGFVGFYLWPNLTLSVFPGEANIAVLQMIPDGAGGTHEIMDWLLPAPEPSTQLADAIRYFDQVLQPEDIGLCESVQRGLHSRGYNQGRFVVDAERSELSEHAVHHFQKMVVDALGARLE